MSSEFQDAIDSLSDIQREAVMWRDGAALVLAGPGSGKTRVLTTRLARLLEESPQKRFRVLALTFTTKAAAEMAERVEQMVPGSVDDRTFIGTFHAFCTQILRQHGSHIGIEPDFGIFDLEREREALLADALEAAAASGSDFVAEDIHFLRAIDEMKARLVVPDKAAKHIRNPRMPAVYKLYEEALRAENALDFNGLILETCRLLAQVPAVAKRIRRTYPYWMVDEFQDTTRAQYWLLHYMTGAEFSNVMCVADDDQIIFQWAGASYRQIERFRDDFKPELIQLVENRRCPAEVVSIANRLVSHNTQRTPDKKKIVPTREAAPDTIFFHEFENSTDESEFVATEISKVSAEDHGEIAVIGRTRALLEPVLTALKAKGVKAAIAQRRDSFASPQFVWLQSCLDQAVRPRNKRVFTTLVNAANRFADMELDPTILIAESEASSQSFLEHWSEVVGHEPESTPQHLAQFTHELIDSRSRWSDVIKRAIPFLLKTEVIEDGTVSDVVEDQRAWDACLREIRSEIGPNPDLAEVVQGLALRSKEPPKDPDAVSLLTVHSSKGLEFDTVYLVGLAEDEMPSWQSVKKGDASPEMEEERRNCFVAITRCKQHLVLSTAKDYRGWQKRRSRFLAEMGWPDAQQELNTQ